MTSEMNCVQGAHYIGLTESTDADKKIKFGHRDVGICRECGNVVGGSTSSDHAKPDQKRFLMSSRIQPAMSTRLFRAELGQIKTKLNVDCLKSIEQCRDALKSIIEDNTGVLRHTEKENILLHIEEDDRVEAVKKSLENTISKISGLLVISPGKGEKEKFKLVLSLCKHYSFFELASRVELVVHQLDTNGDELKKSMLHIMRRFIPVIEKALPVYLVFDLLLEGSFNRYSGLFNVIRNKLLYGEGIELDKIEINPRSKLNIEFDNSVNVQLIWAFFSVLNYWDRSSLTFLEMITDAINKKNAVDLREDNSLIKYLAMRMDNNNNVLKFLCIVKDDLLKHIEYINKKDIYECFTPFEKLIFILRTFSTSNYMIKSDADCLYDYFKNRDQRGCISEFVRLLQNHPVNPLPVVEKSMIEMDEKLNKIFNKKVFDHREEELTNILEKERIAHAEEVASLQSEKHIWKLEKCTLKLEKHALEEKIKSMRIPGSITEAIIDPIMLNVIKDAVITHDGQTFDKSSIVPVIQSTGRCPMTRKPLTVDQLIPNRSLQLIIDGLTQEQKAEIESIS